MSTEEPQGRSGEGRLVAAAWGAFRRALLAGFIVIAPLGLTIWVFTGLVHLADGMIRILPTPLQPESWLGHPLPGLGVLLTVAVVALVGMATRYYAGRRLVELTEAVVDRMPFLGSIYQGTKQLVETMAFQKGTAFRTVVLVEYPRRGAWCLAFLTDPRAGIRVEGAEDADLVSVFLPTTPNPTSGFFLLLPREDVRILDLSVEEAFKLIMSAGIVRPEEPRLARRSGDPGRRVPRGRDEPLGGEGSPAVPPDDDVVEHPDAHHLARLDEAAGDGPVLGGGARVPGRVVVREDDGGGPVGEGGAEHD